MLPPLTIIPAGAGSGKTHAIQQQLGDWIVDGLVAPARIAAVTFTEAAAAELRERIRARLLDLDRLEGALQLDQAYISTIHGFGLRLLTEFAFDAGLSPRPRLLNEDEEDTLIRLALSRTDRADAITADLDRFGYAFDFNSQKSAEDTFRDDLLRIVMLLRSAGWTGESDAHAELAARWIRDRYGMTRDGDRLTTTLSRRVARLLEAYPESLATGFGNRAAAERAFRRDFRNLKAATDDNALGCDWKLWKGLRELRQSRRGCALPQDYDRLAGSVIEAAGALPMHPGPLEQAIRHVRTLIDAGQDVLVHYAAAKREAGLVDYGDMIAMAADMLRSRPDVLGTLVSRIDCLVVDEFQDTNPLQFALLWQLREAGVPTLVVGDPKQAIMGFQGADPRLLETLMRQNREVATPLTGNWRSQPALMHFINAVGSVLFGNDYLRLEPRGADSPQEPVELIDFAIRAKKDQHAVRATSVGERLGDLLDDSGQQVVDRRTGQRRRLRGGDIAVLCPTHGMLSVYARVLRCMGLRVRLQEGGWHESRIVQLACQALAYVANPEDNHAALYLCVTELGHSGLKAALEQLIADGRIDDPVLDRLDRLASCADDRTLFALVADTCSALRLFDVVSLWPDADQARASLLRLQAEAGEFMDANREALVSGGYHGSGIQSFLAWLNAKTGQKGSNAQPEPRVIDEDAIQLVTWHGSKGREWPVVLVCGMDRAPRPGLPDMKLGHDSFDDLSGITGKARIEYSPKFAAPESAARFLDSLKAETALESRRLIYVALTRAREKLVLEWPSYLAGSDAPTYWSILAANASISKPDGTMSIGGSVFSCLIREGKSALPDETADSRDTLETGLPAVGRRAIRPGQAPERLVPDSMTPSGIAACSDATEGGQALETAQYSGGLHLDIGLSGAVLGSFLHRCFEILGASPGQAGSIAVITGVELGEEARTRIAGSVSGFEQWMADRLAPVTVHRELPLLGVDGNGSVVSGTADLVLETGDGLWIIDHKSDRVDEPEAAFSHYRPQLEAYSGLLQGMGYRVLGLGINWIRRGEVVLQHTGDR